MKIKYKFIFLMLSFLLLFICFLWPPYVIGQAVKFLSCGLFFYLSIYLSIRLLVFPRLISAVADWMSTILLHMVWP